MNKCNFVNLEHYYHMKKLAVRNHYIWKWSLNQETPKNWLTAHPIKLFGYCIGWRIEVVDEDYKHLFFTSDEQTN